MLAPSIQSLTTAPLLAGTVPVRPINPSGFVGTVEQDGQIVNVAAIAFDEGKVALMSLVGRDTSVSAVMAQIWKKKEAVFHPTQGIEWEGEYQVFKRLDDHYKQFATQLPGLKMLHAIAIPLGANIAEGILNAPHMAKDARHEDIRVPKVDTHYVLGNVGEETPNALSFLGHLRAMRVVLLYRDDAHPERLVTWASELWQTGSLSSVDRPVACPGRACLENSARGVSVECPGRARHPSKLAPLVIHSFSDWLYPASRFSEGGVFLCPQKGETAMANGTLENLS